MSQIKNTEIDGDLAISRHTAIGGNAIVQGNTTIKCNLKVEGWFEARNLKSVNKGLFKSYEFLCARYPQPKCGWWALVGDTLPADLYVVNDAGAWEFTGKKGGNPTVDFEEYGRDLAELQERSDEQDYAIRTALKTAEKAQDIANLAQTTADKVTSSVNTAVNKAQEAIDAVATLKEYIETMPADEAEACVLKFDGFTSGGVTYEMASLGEQTEYEVLYDKELKKFLGFVEDKDSVSGGIGGIVVPGGRKGTYYLGGHVAAYHQGGLNSEPRSNCLFVDSEQRLWHYDGAALVNTGGESGIKPVVLTQAEYDALESVDADTIYYIVEG